MKNYFNLYAIIWILILFFYYLGWSDLCTTLNIKLLIFIIFTICISLILGKTFSKNFKKKYTLPKPKKEINIFFYIISALFIINMLMGKSIPIINVLKGIQYNQDVVKGLPIFSGILTPILITFSFYYGGLFIQNYKKEYFIKWFFIIILFTIDFSRQNILICLLFFINDFICSKDLKNSKKNIFFIIIAIVAGLFIFGVIGNIRYGRWRWNDSSMIATLGEQNEKYPSILPNEFFWSYIYLVSPLANLNFNIENAKVDDSFRKFSYELLPNFIRKKILNYNSIDLLLPVSSLNVGTEFARPYIAYGFTGMYLIMLLQFMICVFITILCIKKNQSNFLIIKNCCMYFLIFSFFDNTFTYSITAYMMLIAFILCFRYKIK